MVQFEPWHGRMFLKRHPGWENTERTVACWYDGHESEYILSIDELKELVWLLHVFSVRSTHVKVKDQQRTKLTFTKDSNNARLLVNLSNLQSCTFRLVYRAYVSFQRIYNVSLLCYIDHHSQKTLQFIRPFEHIKDRKGKTLKCNVMFLKNMRKT